MSLPYISVIVPTVTGREDHLARCVAAYTDQATGSYDLELIIETDHPTCGLAWQRGSEKANGDYLHFTDDDIEPHPGWYLHALEAVAHGYLPAPQVWSPEGQPQSHPQWGVCCQDWQPVHMTSLPFVSREQFDAIAPLFTAHYLTDDWFSWRAARAGWPTRVRTKYAFTHWWAQVKRGAGMTEWDRLNYDSILYIQAKTMVECGEWTEPWPPAEIARPNG